MEKLNSTDIVRLILWFGSNKTSERKKESKYLREYHSNTRLQKTLYIVMYLTEEFRAVKNNELYEDAGILFRTDMFGPYSVDLAKILIELEINDEIKIKNTGTFTVYLIKSGLVKQLTKKVEVLENTIVDKLINVIYNLNKVPLDEIANYIYQAKKVQQNNSIKINSSAPIPYAGRIGV